MPLGLFNAAYSLMLVGGVLALAFALRAYATMPRTRTALRRVVAVLCATCVCVACVGTLSNGTTTTAAVDDALSWECLCPCAPAKSRPRDDERS